MGKKNKSNPKEKALTKTKPVEEKTPQSSIQLLLEKAITSKVPIETMERLLALHEKWEAGQAKKAFDIAMAAFQGECPTIMKKKGVPTAEGGVAYKYAPLDSIIEQVKRLLEKHGFSYSTQTQTKGEMVKSTCVAKHKFGHSESSSMEVPLGNKTRVMSQTQVVAAALTFAKRYAFCNAFGIMTGDEDSEAAVSEAVIVKPQKTNDQAMFAGSIKRVQEIKGDKKQLLQALTKVDALPISDENKKRIKQEINEYLKEF